MMQKDCRGEGITLYLFPLSCYTLEEHGEER